LPYENVQHPKLHSQKLQVLHSHSWLFSITYIIALWINKYWIL